MKPTFEFLIHTLDSLAEHIVVLDKTGLIVFTNESWRNFGRENNYTSPVQWEGQNYISVCQTAEQSKPPTQNSASLGKV
ncbi:MAG: hypothetical protein ACPGPF_04880 [Pontibacterium sp.]